MMKICQQCGNQNENKAKFCQVCGNNLDVLSQTQQNTGQYDFNTNQQQPNNNQNHESQSYQQQPTYQNNYPPRKNKNVWIAVILDIVGALLFYFLCGIGQLYLGLYKRGIVLCLLGLIPVLILVVLMDSGELAASLISLTVGLALMIYSAYDAYICANAINEGRAVPLLFGALDLQ